MFSSNELYDTFYLSGDRLLQKKLTPILLIPKREIRPICFNDGFFWNERITRGETNPNIYPSLCTTPYELHLQFASKVV